MVPAKLEQALERLIQVTFVKLARDGAIHDGNNLIEGTMKAEEAKRLFRTIVSHLNVLQFVALRQLIMRVADRALHHWLRVLSSTDEIELLITSNNEVFNLRDYAPNLPACLYGSEGWLRRYSSFLYPYHETECAYLRKAQKVPVEPLNIREALSTFPDTAVDWDGRTACEQAAMDKFGWVLMREVRDRTMDEWLGFLIGRAASDSWLEMLERSLPEYWAEQLAGVQAIVVEVLLEVIDSFLHGLLYDLDAWHEYAIRVETALGRVDDLTRVPMLVSLPAELFGDEGWIARFSRYPRASVDRDAG